MNEVINDVVGVAGNGATTPPCITELATAFDDVMASLLKCRREGIEPADALRAIGMNVPTFAAPMLNLTFKNMVEETANAPGGASAIPSADLRSV